MSYDRVRALLQDYLGWQPNHILAMTPLDGSGQRSAEHEPNAYEVAGPQNVVVKFGNISQELKSYERLGRIIPHRVPRVIATDRRSFLVRESIIGEDFRLVVTGETVNPTKRASVILQEILRDLATVWSQRSPNTERIVPFEGMLSRLEGYEMRLQGLLPLDHRVVVNGTICPPVEQILAECRIHYLTPLPIVSQTHGDPFPGNVIVNQTNDYTLIDGHLASHDWLEDLVRIGQWKKHYLVDSYQLTSWWQSRSPCIKYCCELSPLVTELEELAISIAMQFAQKVGDTGWRKRFWLISTLAYLRDAARVKTDQRFIKTTVVRFLEMAWALECFCNYLKLAR